MRMVEHLGNRPARTVRRRAGCSCLEADRRPGHRVRQRRSGERIGGFVMARRRWSRGRNVKPWWVTLHVRDARPRTASNKEQLLYKCTEEAGQTWGRYPRLLGTKAWVALCSWPASSMRCSAPLFAVMAWSSSIRDGCECGTFCASAGGAAPRLKSRSVDGSIATPACGCDPVRAGRPARIAEAEANPIDIMAAEKVVAAWCGSGTTRQPMRAPGVRCCCCCRWCR